MLQYIICMHTKKICICSKNVCNTVIKYLTYITKKNKFECESCMEHG